MYSPEDMQKMVIKIGRLQKKVEKLQNQRNHYKEQMEFRDAILRYYPYAQRTHEEYKQRRKDLEELQMLRKRVKEQELLIERLTPTNE